MKRINIEEYKEYLDKEDYEFIYNDLVDKSIKLSKDIAKMKKIKLLKHDNKEDMAYHIMFTFDRESASFREIVYLMKDITEWGLEDIEEEILIEDVDIDFEDEAINCIYEKGEDSIILKNPLGITEKDKLENIIRKYNALISELEQYHELEKEVDEKGIDAVIEERKEKIIKLFKEMLEFKNKPYDDNWSLREFSDKISQYYNSYHEEISNMVSAAGRGSVSFEIEKDSIRTSEVESIMFMDDFYDLLTDDVFGYKTSADLYRDFELEEGQTYKDLYDAEMEKFKKLFKDMLKHRKIKFDENASLDDLRYKVMYAYPYYYVMLFYFISHDPSTTYIQELDSLEDKYERMSSEYKNHKENMIKYKDYMDLLRKQGYDIDNKFDPLKEKNKTVDKKENKSKKKK